ncbi:hypothetical protein AAC387_Pa11g0066 [Persea americana]
MCKTKTRTDAADPRKTISATRNRPSLSPSTSRSAAATASSLFSSSSTSSASVVSLSTLRSSLPENPLYSFSEISSATNNFRSNRLSSSSSAFRCSLRGRQVAVFQRRISRQLDLQRVLSSLCKCHHSSIADLIGASLSGGNIYLVYEFIAGASLSACLRHPQNPAYTVLSTWISRVQVAADLADGLLYIHRNSGIGGDRGLIHNHLKSSSVIVADPSLNAKICYFGAAELTGELPDDRIRDSGEIRPDPGPALARSGSLKMKVKGKRGYMAPELLTAGTLSQKADVYAFGVVLLEILSGEEPLKYRFDEMRGEYERVSLIERAAEAEEERGLRRWIDRRLRDSFPIDVAERMTRVALECVQEEPEKRPDMEAVAGVVSRLYLESKGWAEKMRVPTDFSVSMAPR